MKAPIDTTVAGPKVATLPSAMKKTPLVLAAALLAVPVLAVEPASVIPQNFPPERYAALIARSPFTLATPPAAPAAPPDKGFADDWYVTSIARVDGQDFVSIKARDGGVQFSLFGTDPKDGVALQKIDWSPGIGLSTVSVTKDGQTARLHFNQAEIAAQAQAPAMPPQQPNIVRPGVPGAAPRPTVPRPAQPVVQPQVFNAGPPKQPFVNQAVPRPAGGVSGGGVIPNITNPVNNPNAAGTDSRRRIRVIQNTPGQ